MIKRDILAKMDEWAIKKNRKPLVIRGARQVGKTTLVHQFAKKYKQYLYLNLELRQDKKPFLGFQDVETLLQSLFFLKDKSYSLRAQTLIFIDEIQEVPEAFNILRYFYESAPEIHIVVAGSLLETIFNATLSFPVGRVEFLLLRPLSFHEFLLALDEKTALEQLNQIPIPLFAHEKLLKLFHTYALIGGMPEIISTYAETKDLFALKSIYDSLLSSYLDDVEKYANSKLQIQSIRHCIRTAFYEAGKRIKFQGFGKSSYGSREMSEALRTLEKAFLLQLIHPTTSSQLPIKPELKKSPRLQFLDTGLVNFYLGIQKEIIGTNDLNKIHQGTLIEHLVGQELLAHQFNSLSALNFWVREKTTSTAEMDYVLSHNGKLIPIEVKSGKEGKLKSLHLFMDESSQSYAFRLYAGKFEITEAITPKGKKYKLINLPYYLGYKIADYCDWMEGNN